MWLVAGAVAVATLAIVAAVLRYLLVHRVRGTTFDSAGVRLHYTDEGAGDLVVLLHGFAVNADLNWRRPGITPALARDFRVVAMDLRGHGLSGKPHDPAGYGAHMGEDVVRLLDHLAVARAHVVGYSLGGFIALWLAARHPDRVATVAACGAGWEPPENSTFLAALEQLAADLEAGRSIRPLMAHLGPDREQPGLLHTLWVRLMTKYFNDPHALIGVIRGLPELTLTEADLRGISVPTCSIVGGEDPIRRSAEAMVGRVPDLTRTVIPGADHVRAPGRPELVQTVRTFLQAHPADPAAALETPSG